MSCVDLLLLFQKIIGWEKVNWQNYNGITDKFMLKLNE